MSEITEAVRALAASLPEDALPAYVYDLDALRSHVAFIRAALPERVELYYAAKANPETRILGALAPYVDGFEISSGGELAHVTAVGTGRPLAFGGPGKTRAEVEAALRAGVERVHVESEHELRVLNHLAASMPEAAARVLLRVNLEWPSGLSPAGQLVMGGGPSPFGMDPGVADAVLASALPARDGSGMVELVGVHAHLASGLDAAELLTVARSVVAWASDLFDRHGVPLREVNIGGGMAVSYLDPGARFDWAAYGAGLADLLGAYPDLVLRIEPGRALTAYCGWYATEVLDVKGSHGRQFAVVRGGTHHLRTPAAKGHDQPCVVVPVAEWPHPWPRPAGNGEPVTLVGQLCTPKDVLARDVKAPGLRAGDRVVFGMAGAYAWNISHHDFLMHPPPGVHFLSSGAPAPDVPAPCGTALRVTTLGVTASGTTQPPPRHPPSRSPR